MNKNVLSIIIEQTEGGNGIAQKQFLTCNYDLVKDKILTFDEIYKDRTGKEFKFSDFLSC